MSSIEFLREDLSLFLNNNEPMRIELDLIAVDLGEIKRRIATCREDCQVNEERKYELLSCRHELDQFIHRILKVYTNYALLWAKQKASQGNTTAVLEDMVSSLRVRWRISYPR